MKIRHGFVSNSSSSSFVIVSNNSTFIEKNKNSFNRIVFKEENIKNYKDIVKKIKQSINIENIIQLLLEEKYIAVEINVEYGAEGDVLNAINLFTDDDTHLIHVN